MSGTPRPKTLYDDLTVEQRAKLKKLSTEIAIDKVTVSFSIEDRDPHGRKKSAFYSVTASRGAGAEVTQMQEEAASTGFTLEGVKLTRALLSRHVVQATYDDAFRRKILSFSEDNKAERDAILASYDQVIVGLLGGVNKGPGDPPAGGTPPP